MNNGDHCLKLPPELIIAIIQEVDDFEHLRVLATVSRFFHQISMEAYFSRCKFDLHSKTIHLKFNAWLSFKEIQIVKGLNTYLWNRGAHLDEFSYTQTQIEPSSELMVPLTRYLEKLSSIEKVSITVHQVNPRTVAKIQRRTTTIIFLKTALEKASKSFRIGARTWTDQQALAIDGSDWLRDYWPKGHEPSPDTPRHLEEVTVSVFSVFIMQFYYHILSSNASSLTSVNFEFIAPKKGSLWATMLEDLHFPRLSRLSVVRSGIPRNPFVKFLAEHRNIQEFHFLQIQYTPNPRRRMRVKGDAFEHLHTIVTNPDLLLHFFPPIHRMVALKSITLEIEIKDKTFKSIEKVLWCLASCRNKIALLIKITRKSELGFGVWLNVITRNGLAGRPEPLLHGIDSLSIDNGPWKLDVAIDIPRIPAWVRSFPALKTFTMSADISAGGLPVQLAENKNVEAFKNACPGIHVEWHQVEQWYK